MRPLCPLVSTIEHREGFDLEFTAHSEKGERKSRKNLLPEMMWRSGSQNRDMRVSLAMLR
jgi:hypothetical protein